MVVLSFDIEKLPVYLKVVLSPQKFALTGMKKEYSRYYFIGIGGIGMSALARYFKHEGKQVAGYDLTPSPLIKTLETEGIPIHYSDDTGLIPAGFTDREQTLVVYTPAVPKDHGELTYFLAHGFEVVKRSEMLGMISGGKYVMAVAGTHGKTTISTMLAWFNREAALNPDGTTDGGSAFLGGISKNTGSNLMLGKGRRLVVEADEFDRSFLRLHPDIALVSSTDADHLDIYQSHQSLKDAFGQFCSQIKSGGALVRKKGIDLTVDRKDISMYTYAFDEPCDFYAKNVAQEDDGHYVFDLVCPDRVIEGCRLKGIWGAVNVENCVGAAAMMWCSGFDEQKLKEAFTTFLGVRRRFDIYINTPQVIYMDDYAHHPKELFAALTSVRKLFPGKEITAVFQPHLYTRTRDFAEEFAESLSLADRVLLLPIYPARELPIEGVDSEMILKNITCEKEMVQKDALLDRIKNMNSKIIITFGAGDIDRLCQPIAELLKEKYNVTLTNHRGIF